MDRRRFLTASIAAGTVALSGCAAISDEGDLSPPSFDDAAKGDAWEQFDSTSSVALEQDVGPVHVTATQQTVLLENAELRTELSEKTLGGLDAQLSIAFATRVDIDPGLDQLPGGLGRGQLMSQLEDSAVNGFKSQLSSSGIEDVEAVGETTITTDDGTDVTATEYEGVYAFDAISFDVTDDKSITLEGDELVVTGWLATWHDGVGPLIAGGVYPGENFVKSVEEALTEGITVRLDVDLGFEPASYEEEVLDLVGSVE